MPAPMSRSLALPLLAAAFSLPGWLSAADAEKLAAAPVASSLLRQIEEGFVQVYEKVAPTVVVIEATKRPAEDEIEEPRGFDLAPDDPKDPRRGDRSKDAALPPGSWRLPQPPSRSEGSGFIIRPDGHILTNVHVIAEAEKLSVRLKDGRNFPARVLGTDDKTDIAVIKIEARDLPAAEMGDSDAIRVGQLVCAIGAPFNQDYSFTCGWVSGKGRTNLLSPSSATILYEDYIQTDAFINPGNSGGPLFDVEGRVVGMNTLINGIGRGLAFAIPSNILQQIGGQLILAGKVVRPWLGIRIESLGQNPALRERVIGLDRGVVVDTIEANAPAYKSDLRPADIITEVDGAKISTAHDLQKEVLKKRVGQTVQLTVWRSGATLKIPVTTGELPTEFTRVVNPAPKKPAAEQPKDQPFGLRLRDTKGGAQVVEVAPDSAAALAELQPEDVITEVENKAVSNSAACLGAIRAAGEKAGRRGVLLNIDRKGKRTYAVLNPPAR
jgi:serine protease Do